ncbi:MAG: fibronectin type III domain-containing protein, partial [Phaeodactylibacter sp.]|nr:fibronectin type III domain-containing protein [Phaeodactylibacter sp.]
GGGNGGGNPTGSCGVPEGLAASAITTTSALLSWNSVPGALRYEVEVEDDENTVAYEFDAISMDTAIMVIGLMPGGQYQFKVKARCSGGNSDYSTWSFFSTPTGSPSPVTAPASTAAVVLQREAQELAFRLYPNPVRPNSEVILDFDLLAEPAAVHILLTDMQGRTLASRQLEGFEGGASVELPVGALPAGLYQVAVQSGRDVSSRRLLVSGQ